MDVGKTISVLIHSMNRAYDLKKSMPHVVTAANQSPPVEILVLNYSSKDDLDGFMKKTIKETRLVKGNFFSYWKTDGKKFYNSPNARNIAQLRSKGEYGIQWACDSYCKPEFIKTLRDLIEKHSPDWLCEGTIGRAVTCRKDVFIKAGGYDERFDYYAPEDKDICMRLQRRGLKLAIFPKDLIWDIPTPWTDKWKNTRVKGKSRTTRTKMVDIWKENIRNNVLVANEGKEWGK